VRVPSRWVASARSHMALEFRLFKVLREHTPKGKAPTRSPTFWMEAGSIILLGQKSASGLQILPLSTCALPFTCTQESFCLGLLNRITHQRDTG